MADDSRLLDLLELWEERFKAGEDLPPEQICHDAPHLVGPLADRIAELKRLAWLDRSAARNSGSSTPGEMSSPLGDDWRDRFEDDRPAEISLDEFLTRLAQSGLLSPGDVALIRRATSEAGGPPDAHMLADRLADEFRLTRYQAKALLAGSPRALVLGEYVIVDEVGAGGVGQVFKAVHRRLEKAFALKLLHEQVVSSPALARRFQQEVRVAAKLDHPHIVKAVYSAEDRGIHYFVMELVEGHDLSSVVRRWGPLSVGDAIRYTLQAADGLAYAHAQGIVHRDVKPGNLLVDKQGQIKILDLGLARLKTSASEDLTLTGMAIGTARYMAPEQAENSKLVDQRADIYSLGCTLFHMLTGEDPYSGQSFIEIVFAHRERPIPQLADYRHDCPDGLQQIFERMVAKRADDRFHSMEQVLTDLRAVAGVSGQELPIGETVIADRPGVKSDSTRTAARPPANGPRDEYVRATAVADDTASVPVVRPTAEVGRRGGRGWNWFAAALVLAIMACGGYLLATPRDCGPAPPSDGSPSERMAAWVFALGGEVEIALPSGRRDVVTGFIRSDRLDTPELGGVAGETARLKPGTTDPRFVRRGDELPKEFTLTGIDLARSRALTDCGLEHLREAPESLTKLVLSNTGITDAGLKRLTVLKGLEVLDLSDTAVTSNGLASLKPLTRLRRLYLGNTPIDDAGLDHLVGLDRLELLSVSQTDVDGSGFARLAGLSKLQTLFAGRRSNEPISLQPIAKLTRLRDLRLSNSAIERDALAELVALKELERLDLTNCDLLAADLAPLRDLRVKSLDLTGSNLPTGANP